MVAICDLKTAPQLRPKSDEFQQKFTLHTALGTRLLDTDNGGNIVRPMPVAPEDLAMKAMEMPSESRARLADLWVESLDDAALNSIDRAWAEEAKRRLAEIREGKVEPIPGDEAFQRVRDSFKR